MAIKIRIVSDFDKKGITEADKALNNLSNVAATALAAVAAATAGIAVASVREFSKFDAALVKSTAIMGDLTQALEKDMANAAREVAKVTTFSAEQAAESYFFLASAGLDAKSSIMALPQVAQFAQAGMFDMALATDLLTDAQSALGLTIRDDAVKNMENMVKVSDVLVRANTLANASVEQFSVALTTKAGAALRALGKDVEEGVAVLAAFADQGIKGEIAGTQLSIVLRDLTTKAINNKTAFDKMGIAVFDSNGEMNNLGDIIGNLEVALAGMSDETQKATLLQLGFSDKSLASLQALLGTSEAIKTYEKELRSASGFTGDVATKQLESFESQMKLLESAVIDVAIEIGQELTPYLQELIPVIQKLLPEIGAKLAAAVKQVDWAALTESVANFFIEFVENIDTIVEIARVIGLLAIGLVTYTTVVKLANAATAVFNSTLRLNPFAAMATVIVTATIALQGFHEELKRNREAATGLSGRTAEINAEFARLKELLDAGVISFSQYRDQIDPLVVELSRLEGQFGATAGEANRFNNLTLGNARAEMQATAELGAKLANNQRQLYFAMKGLDPSKGLLEQAPVITPAATVASTGPSQADMARKQVERILKDANKQITQAQKTYNTSIEQANKNFADSILKLQADFGNRLEGIIQSSQDRLRNAYKSAVETNIAALFDQQEEKSVAGLVKSLSDKLTASRNLLANSAQLASQGFSQTFIEQIVSAGTETGNELASAILNSTPEAQQELKTLFSALETESQQGMDALAEQIYTSQGLATQELKNLYETTQTELADALLEQQGLLDQSLLDANDALVESLKTIRESVAEQVADIEGMFGSLERSVDSLMSKLDKLIAKYASVNNASQVRPSSPITPITVPVVPKVDTTATKNVVTGEVEDAVIDVVKETTKQLGDRLAANQRELYFAQRGLDQSQSLFAPVNLPIISPSAMVNTTTLGGVLTASRGTTINVNVKTDATQSTAMVGRQVASSLQQYLNTGGNIRNLRG